MITEERFVQFRKSGLWLMAEKSFEQNLKALEKIVDKLESGSVSLDESLKLFQKGKALNKACVTRLEEAKLKIESLVEDEEGNVGLEDFETGSEVDSQTAKEDSDS